jgi:hypothetical protein
MSTICIVSIGLPYKTFAFVPRFLFPWSYSPGAFLLWVALCVTPRVMAGIWGSRLWFLGCMGGFYARVRDERGSLVGNCCNRRQFTLKFRLLFIQST